LCLNAKRPIPMVASLFIDCSGCILLLDHTGE